MLNPSMRVIDAIRKALDTSDDADHTTTLNSQLAYLMGFYEEDMAPYKHWLEGDREPLPEGI